VAGLKKVLNQAYRRLSDVLDLPGSDFLGHVDTDAAIAVHPLDAVVQTERVFMVQWDWVHTGAGAAATVYNSRGIRDITAWDYIRRWRVGDSGTGELLGGTSSGITGVNLPADWDYWILGFGVGELVATIDSWQALLEADHSATNVAVPLTSVWSRTVAQGTPTSGNWKQPAAGDPAYYRPMPVRVHPRMRGVSFNIAHSGGAGAQAETLMAGLMAPPGVLPYFVQA
jgi:hypothetical protein